MKKQKITFGDTAKFAWYYISQQPWKLAISFLGIILVAGIEIAQPIIYGKLVDVLAQNYGNSQEAIRGLFLYLGLFMGSGILFWIFRHSGWFIWAKVVINSMKKSIEESFFKVQRFSSDWHANTFAGSNVTKVKRGARGLQKFIDLFYYEFFPIFFVFIGITISITIKVPLLGLVMTFLSIIYALVSIYLSIKYVLPKNHEANRVDSKIGGTLADSFSCNPSVKSFGREKYEDKIFKKVTSIFKKKEHGLWVTGEYVHIVQNILMTTYKGVMLGWGAYLWYIGTFTVGDFVFVYTSYRYIASMLRNIGSHVRHLFVAVGDMEDMIYFYKLPLQIKEKPGAKKLKINKGEIEFNNVLFSYENQKNSIFKNFNLKIKPGEKVALVGHSGSGKTTFVKLLERLYDINKGEILIDGQNISKVTIESLRQNTVLVPQEPILFHRSLAENISYGNTKATKKDIEEAGKKAHAHDFISNLDKGYKTLVGERGVKLSGGERQRVAIARAILADKKILILDEATSALDSESEKYIQTAMKKLMENKTAIVVAHRLSTIRNVDRILVFEKGKIVEEGTHQSLIRKKNGTYKKFFEMQAEGFIRD